MPAGSTQPITPAIAQESLLPVSVIKRALIKNRARIWKDPASVREARIGQPYRCPLGGTCICVEANAKNSYGGYSGVKKSGFAFRSATDFDVLGEMGRYATCGTFTPFPEMNGRKS